MTSYFQQQGRSLLANGYLIVPIEPGHKRPALASWQRARLSTADLPSYPAHGVGVLCGQGAHPIVGIDIDVSHAGVNAALVAWCREHLGVSCERVGAAPRVLLTYRAAAAGWTKEASSAFFDPADPVKADGKRNEQRIEILGFGQQFVAYHTHPDTGRPYEWVDMLGGIEYMRADDLPVITEQQVAALMAEFDRLVAATPGLETSRPAAGTALVRTAGAAPGGEGDALRGLSPTIGLTMDEARTLLGHLDNTGFDKDYDFWLRVGMALHHEFGGSDEALALWIEWSEHSPKYESGVCAPKWRSFGKGGHSPTTARWLIMVANQEKRDREGTDKRERLERILETISAATDTVTLTGETAAKVRDLLPDDSALRAQVFGTFQARFKHLTGGTTLPIAEVRTLLLPAKTPNVQRQRPLTEFGNADRMLDRFGAGLMFVPEAQTWYVWTGVHWRDAVEEEIENLARETVNALATEQDQHSDAAEFYKFCSVSQSHRMVRSMVALAASSPRVLVPAGELDKHPSLLGVRNGVVDLRTGALLPPDPELRITRVAACNYVPGARCDLWLQTLRDVFHGDEDMVLFFQRLLGYTILGQPKEDILVIPYGTGSNGKSTTLGTVRSVLGSHARAADANTFVSDGKTRGNAGGAREDVLRLKGARLVYVNEPDEGSELREGAVKAMTGGDAITARGLFAKKSIEMLPTWVAFMPTNHKPIVKGNDNGIWRRLLLIPFTRSFDDDPTVVKDKHRDARLAAEHEGILAWLVAGALEYQRHGLAAPPQVRAAREAYRSQMDLLAEWLEECCETGPEHSTTVTALWHSWEQFARTRGVLQYVKSSVALSRRLDSRFPAAKGTGGVRIRKGLRVRPVSDPFGEAQSGGSGG